jgi:hypothetical protein
MKPKTPFFITVTGIMMVIMVVVVGIRFGMQKNFMVTLQPLCGKDTSGCTSVVCDEMYQDTLGCSIDEEIFVKPYDVPGKQFLLCYKGAASCNQ